MSWFCTVEKLNVSELLFGTGSQAQHFVQISQKKYDVQHISAHDIFTLCIYYSMQR